MLLSSLRQIVNEDLLRFLWRQWSQLGVAGDVEFKDSWIIDPEALLLFTLDVARCDPRLFDEVVDWTVSNGRWVSLQRLKNIADSVGDASKRTLAAVATVIDAYDTKHRWRSISRMATSSSERGDPFFRDVRGDTFPVVGEADHHFSSMGFTRQKIALRGLSVAVPMGPSANLLFKLRALFGLSPRAEVAAYLLTHPVGKASVIARSAVYSHPSIHDTLEELSQSGLIYTQQRGLYSIDVPRWHQFLEIESPLPDWVEWPRVFAALSALVKFLVETEQIAMSDYLVRSRILALYDILREKLHNSGIANPFLRASTLDAAVELLPQRIQQLMNEINGCNVDLSKSLQ